MPTPITSPSILNVHSQLWQIIKKDWKFWVFLLFAICGLPFVWILSIVPLFIYYAWGYTQMEKKFWQAIAEANGWHYESSEISEKIPALTMHAGDRRETKHTIRGQLGDRAFSTFSYAYYIKRDKTEDSYHFQVFSFETKGSFPHLYLNNRHNQTNLSAGERIPLPVQFEKEFLLLAPKQYEIEALAIFTPDVLQKILEGSFTSDIELVDGQMVIFTDSQIFEFTDFKARLEKAEALKDILCTTLDASRLEKIGNINPTLETGWVQIS